MLKKFPPRYVAAVKQAAVAAAQKGVYDPKRPADAPEEALFSIWSNAVRIFRAHHSLGTIDLNRNSIVPQSPLSYERFCRSFCKRAREHQGTTLQ